MLEQSSSTVLEPASWSVGVERRVSVRFPASLRAVYRVLGADGAAGRAQVRNLSTLGVGLTLPQPVGPSTLLRLDFQGAAGETVCSRLARVVHAEAGAEGNVGCAFVRELGDRTLRLFDAQRLPTTGGDDRRWVRFPCNVETACYALDTAPGEHSPARIINISAGGMGLLLPCEFAAGTLLKLDLEGTNAHAAGPILLRLVRAIGRRDGDWFHGCEFVDPLRDEELSVLV